MHAQIIRDANRKNIAAIYWTIDCPDEMRHLISINADGIITGRPDLLKAILDQMN